MRRASSFRTSWVLLRLDSPAPGVAFASTYAWGGQVKMTVSLFFYGQDAQAIAAKEEPRWQAWLESLGTQRN